MSQIHEWTQADSVESTDYFAIDTGTMTYKVPASVLVDALKSIGSLVTGVKGNAENSYRTGNVNITPANIGALPAANAVTGVKGNTESSYRNGNVNITPANIGAQPASTAVTGVKGSAETNYRIGNVNITPANVGAVAKTGDTMTGQLNVKTNFNAHTTHPADGQFTPINFSDSTDNVIGILRENYTAAGRYYLQIASRDDSSGSVLFNSLYLGFDENGNRTVALDEPALWRNAMRAVGYTATGSTPIPHIYTGVASLGLTSGSATIIAAFRALPDGGILYANANQFASAEVPATTGVVEINRIIEGPRGVVSFYGKTSSTGDHRMFEGATAYNGNNTNEPDGVWHKITMT